MIFVDTNYFLRFLLNDIKQQHKEAKKLFIQASEGEASLFTSTIVIFEIYWVLSSFYEKDKVQISQTLNNVLKDFIFIHLPERTLLLKALEIYTTTNFDLEDSYNLVYANKKQAEDFKTFDKKLLKEFNNGKKADRK